jgi:hypothetical protein
MTKLFLAAGVAALAIAAPVSAKPDKGGGGEHKAHAVKGGGGQAKGFKAKGADRQFKAREFKNAAKAKGPNREFKAAKGSGFKAVNKSKGDDRRFAKLDRKDRDVVRVRDFDDDRFDRRLRTADWDGNNGWCPPGHAKANCMPPGQYKKHVLGQSIPAAFRNSMLPLGLRDLYRDDDDFYYRLGDNGYLFRVDRDTNLVASLLPLFGAGLMPGQMFPSTFGNPFMPQPFQAFYQDTPDDYYRFANGYVYEIDRDTGMIESMVPLMANGYGMGQMLPLSYSAYNVPVQYRGLYADNNDYMYRYAPGAIYQVDPTTRLITAVASLLTGQGLSVGQTLPMGFSTYNVPLAYRDQYYDTPDAWYRYNNGNIYQVDPTTQLVTALIRAIV